MRVGGAHLNSTSCWGVPLFGNIMTQRFVPLLVLCSPSHWFTVLVVVRPGEVQWPIISVLGIGCPLSGKLCAKKKGKYNHNRSLTSLISAHLAEVANVAFLVCLEIYNETMQTDICSEHLKKCPSLIHMLNENFETVR